MKLDRLAQTPLYQQVRNYIDTRISSGELQPGQRLPSEKELEAQFGVSRITTRQALSVLSQENKVVRVPGKGTFVSPKKADSLTALSGFTENMRARGLTPSFTQTSVKFVNPSSNVRIRLKLADGEQAVHLQRLMMADGAPMAFQDAYLPRAVLRDYSASSLQAKLKESSLYHWLEHDQNIPLVRGDEYVEPSTGTPREIKLLGLQKGDLVLVITRITYSTDDYPVEFVKLVFRADRYRYHVKLSRQR